MINSIASFASAWSGRKLIFGLAALLCSYFIWAFYSPPVYASGSPGSILTIKGDSSGAYINPQLSYFLDEQDKMSAADVLSSAVFKPTDGRTGLGLQRHAVWLRLDLQRTADAPRQWWVEYLPYSVHEVQMFIVRDGQIVATPATGGRAPA